MSVSTKSISCDVFQSPLSPQVITTSQEITSVAHSEAILLDNNSKGLGPVLLKLPVSLEGCDMQHLEGKTNWLRKQEQKQMMNFNISC
jgi:hypothetical protein